MNRIACNTITSLGMERIGLRLILALLPMLILISTQCQAQSNKQVDIGKFILDKEICSAIRKTDGKCFKLNGKVKIVNSFEDIKVKIVDSFEDIDVRMREYNTYNCCEFRIVESFEDVKIKIVDSFEDIKVKVVDAFPGIKK